MKNYTLINDISHSLQKVRVAVKLYEIFSISFAEI